jgi:hypothetical protein
MVIGVLILGVAIVAWATRRKPSRPAAQRLEQDTAWADPVTPAGAPTEARTDPFPTEAPTPATSTDPRP